jgi:hypothetical protein
MSKIISQTLPVSRLTPSERATMFGLLSFEFLGVSRQDFTRDLEEKESVMLLRLGSPDGEIVGFSTLVTLDLPTAGRPTKAVFSGDTSILPAHRSSLGFGLEIARYFLRAIESNPNVDLYYVLMSKGWRTFRVLPFFFREFSPAPDVSVSREHQAVRDAFGAAKYPREYDPERGIILFARETQRLVPGSVDAVPPPDPDAHTRFFLRANPTYLSGTELVCVAPVTRANFAPAMLRLVGRVEREVLA